MSTTSSHTELEEPSPVQPLHIAPIQTTEAKLVRDLIHFENKETIVASPRRVGEAHIVCNQIKYHLEMQRDAVKLLLESLDTDLERLKRSQFLESNNDKYPSTIYLNLTKRTISDDVIEFILNEQNLINDFKNQLQRRIKKRDEGKDEK
jgi:hypothetical protein